MCFTIRTNAAARNSPANSDAAAETMGISVPRLGHGIKINIRVDAPDLSVQPSPAKSEHGVPNDMNPGHQNAAGHSVSPCSTARSDNGAAAMNVEASVVSTTLAEQAAGILRAAWFHVEN